ncbi:stationary-phase-induced ribosome-associated protein [Serratia fonticola]|uniref:stationary-phase-induced ribosome-associated protein n=1 Tax=Serratia fonticola TaxID=47917 RepID=UPI00374DE573
MKSNRQARRALNMPHWLSNTQFQAKCKHTGEWTVTQTRSWAASEGFYLSRQSIAFRRAAVRSGQHTQGERE